MALRIKGAESGVFGDSRVCEAAVELRKIVAALTIGLGRTDQGQGQENRQSPSNPFRH